MKIDWHLVREVTLPIITLLLGKYLDVWLVKRPKLLAWFTHSAAFNIPGDNPVTIHMHGVIIRNTGKKTATNLRIGHHVLPRDFTVYPTANFSVSRNTQGGGEILIPTLVAGEQITISYLYFPPLLWSQIHAYTKSDEGSVENITVLPTPQPAKWLVVMAQALMLIGAVTGVYVLVDLIRTYL